MIRLVLSDVDGTLVPLGQEHPSERVLHAIRDVRKAGIRFGLATGRDRVELLKIFDGDESIMDTGILSNGKKIMADGKIARLTLLENEALERLATLVDEFERSFLCIYPFETSAENPIYCIHTNPEEAGEVSKRFSFTPLYVDEVPRIQVIGATISCEADQSVMDEIRKRGAELCPEFDFLQPAPFWCDVLPRGLNKGTALPALLEFVDVRPEEVAFFGDAENDLSLLLTVENSVAVANATPAAAKAARWHIGACEDDGMADALEDIARAARAGTMPSFML